MTRLCAPVLRAAALAMVAAASVPGPALAQSPVPDAAPATSAWRISPTLDVETGFDNNVFLLDAGKKADVASPSGSDVTSGRLADMKSAGDVVTTLRLAGLLHGRGLFDQSLKLAPEIRYDAYAMNTRRSNLRLALGATQSLPHGGRLGLEGRLAPSFFSKNYLADATDLDASGTITSDERLYQAGVYSEHEVLAEYRARILRATPERDLEAKLQLGAGYTGRRYRAPFEGRDLAGPTGSTGLLLGFGSRASLDIVYEVAALSAEPAPQVLLLDEPDFGMDFNGDGNVQDANVRTVQVVDRSRTEHSLGTRLDLELGPTTRMRLSYEYRLRDFTSDQPFDVVDRGRRDTRSSVGGDVSFLMARGLRLAVGGELASQKTNRAGDPGSVGEVDDYSRARTSVRLVYPL